jgi:cell division protease FtsH
MKIPLLMEEIPPGPTVFLLARVLILGMTGADLANLVTEAALLAARREQDHAHQRDLTDALEKVQPGTARTVVIPAEERRRTAYH